MNPDEHAQDSSSVERIESLFRVSNSKADASPKEDMLEIILAEHNNLPENMRKELIFLRAMRCQCCCVAVPNSFVSLGYLGIISPAGSRSWRNLRRTLNFAEMLRRGTLASFL